MPEPTKGVAFGGDPAPSLGRKAFAGVAWNLVGTAVKIGTRLAALVVIARELTPVDFAIGGLGLAAIAFFSVLTARSFAQALIQRSELSELACHSVFWVVTIGGLIIGGLAFAGAPLLANFYEQPALVAVVRILAAGLFFSLLGSVPNALLQRQIRFKALNLVEMVCGLLAAGAGIWMALLGCGYYSLIVPGVGVAMLQSLAVFPLAGYRPALRFSRAEIRKLSAFGFSELGSSVILFFNDNADYLILSRFWSPATFGQYFFAFERSRQPFNLLYPQLSSVLFPSFSRIQTDHEKLRSLFLKGTRGFCLVMFPLFLVLVGLADSLLPLVFGDQWRPAVPVFMVFTSWMFFRSLAVMVPSMLQALNRAQTILYFNLFRFAVLMPTLLLLGFYGAGIVTAAVVLVTVWVLQLPVFVGSLMRIITLGIRETWRSLRVVWLSAAGMAVLLVALRGLAWVTGLPDWAMLLVCLTLPAAGYAYLTRGEIRKAWMEIRRVASLTGADKPQAGDGREPL